MKQKEARRKQSEPRQLGVYRRKVFAVILQNRDN